MNFNDCPVKLEKHEQIAVMLFDKMFREVSKMHKDKSKKKQESLHIATSLSVLIEYMKFYFVHIFEKIKKENGSDLNEDILEDSYYRMCHLINKNLIEINELIFEKK